MLVLAVARRMREVFRLSYFFLTIQLWFIKPLFLSRGFEQLKMENGAFGEQHGCLVFICCVKFLISFKFDIFIPRFLSFRDTINKQNNWNSWVGSYRFRHCL